MEKDFTTSSIDINKKIDNLEAKYNNLYNFFNRPQINQNYQSNLNNPIYSYLKTGQINEFVQKSLNAGNSDGGVLVTPTLSEKIITGIYARSPMRKLASREVISTNALDLVLEDGLFDGGWVGETDARPVTDNPKLLQKRIFIHEIYAQPKATQKLIDDAEINIENWLAESIRDSFLRLENSAFIDGNGDKKPFGILHYAEDQNIKKIEQEVDKITSEGLLALVNSLDEEYISNATFMMNRVTLSKIQKLKDNNGRFIWQQSLSESFGQTLFGIPIVCLSNMPNTAENSYAVALADFKSAYKIVDRSDITIMRDPYTEKPFVKFYAVKRVGGDVVNRKALSLMKFVK